MKNKYFLVSKNILKNLGRDLPTYIYYGKMIYIFV